MFQKIFFFHLTLKKPPMLSSHQIWALIIPATLVWAKRLPPTSSLFKFQYPEFSSVHHTDYLLDIKLILSFHYILNQTLWTEQLTVFHRSELLNCSPSCFTTKRKFSVAAEVFTRRITPLNIFYLIFRLISTWKVNTRTMEVTCLGSIV